MYVYDLSGMTCVDIVVDTAALYSQNSKHVIFDLVHDNDRFVRPNFEDVPDPVVVRLAGMENERELEQDVGWSVPCVSIQLTLSQDVAGRYLVQLTLSQVDSTDPFAKKMWQCFVW